jgi:hypothetical protein
MTSRLLLMCYNYNSWNSFHSFVLLLFLYVELYYVIFYSLPGPESNKKPSSHLGFLVDSVLKDLAKILR